MNPVPIISPEGILKTGRISKCTMCFERVSKGMLPACVKSCPSGAMNFGDRQDMLDLAKKRLDQLKKEYPKAILADAENVNTIYLLIDEPNKYHEFSVAQKSPEYGSKAISGQDVRIHAKTRFHCGKLITGAPLFRSNPKARLSFRWRGEQQ